MFCVKCGAINDDNSAKCKECKEPFQTTKISSGVSLLTFVGMLLCFSLVAACWIMVWVSFKSPEEQKVRIARSTSAVVEPDVKDNNSNKVKPQQGIEMLQEAMESPEISNLIRKVELSPDGVTANYLVYDEAWNTFSHTDKEEIVDNLHGVWTAIINYGHPEKTFISIINEKGDNVGGANGNDKWAY
jgi:hypothetical protein